ncbi:hypothetical protein PJL18_03645 [Paenarthrobacter nicotinovorans]|nr:hypothetical protein [Paenarthrobacter nicotinovorans]
MVQKAERVGSPRSRGGNPLRKPIGNITRGTTNPNRMRRLDRWLAGPQAGSDTQSRAHETIALITYAVFCLKKKKAGVN